MIYEILKHENPNFPIIFHLDRFQKNKSFLPHWHESLEIIYVIEGTLCLSCNGNAVTVEKDNLAVVNSGAIHEISSVSDESLYYCLIIDNDFCADFGISIEDRDFDRVLSDKEMIAYYRQIIDEMNSKSDHFAEAVKAVAILIVLLYCRKYCKSYEKSQDKNYTRTKMVKDAISYIKNHLHSPMSVDDICSHIGFSKFYFCREFKALTGFTVIDYINYSRCATARQLIASGKYNVGQSARKCGFDNLSYFTKVYKKHMGHAPSKEVVTQTSLQNTTDYLHANL